MIRNISKNDLFENSNQHPYSDFIEELIIEYHFKLENIELKLDKIEEQCINLSKIKHDNICDFDAENQKLIDKFESMRRRYFDKMITYENKIDMLNNLLVQFQPIKSHKIPPL